MLVWCMRTEEGVSQRCPLMTREWVLWASSEFELPKDEHNGDMRPRPMSKSPCGTGFEESDSLRPTDVVVARLHHRIRFSCMKPSHTCRGKGWGSAV
jgi:hypothetical protein